jgi:predicted MFS family arabinose efflux permease
VGADTVTAIATALIPLLYLTTGLQFWQLLILVFFSSLLDIPSFTARRSMVPELAGRAGMPLDRANAVFESLMGFSTLVGAPLAGLLVATMGARNVIWLDASASAISAVLVLATIPGGMFTRVAFETRGMVADIRAGLSFIRRDVVLWPMAIVLALSNGTSAAVTGLVLPVYVKDTFGDATSLGLMISAVGAGALLGSTAYGWFATRVSRRLLWYAGYLLVPLEWWIFLVSPTAAMIVAAFFITGLAMGPINPIMVTLRHERSPAEVRGRVFSTYSAIAMSTSPIGILAAGWMIEGIGFDPTVLVFALIGQAIGIATLVIPGFRLMDRPASSGPVTESQVSPVI